MKKCYFRRFFSLLGLSFCILLSSGIGSLYAQPQTIAEDAQTVAKARQYFRAGAQAYSVGEFATAVQAFEQAYSLAPRPAVLFSLAQAERRLYFLAHERPHLERAISFYRSYLEAEPQAARKADAVQALSELEPLIKSTGQTPQQAEPEVTPREHFGALPTRLMLTSHAADAKISLDGAPPQPSPLIREVEPGEHLILVTAPGHQDDERKIFAVKGALVAVDLPLVELPAKLIVRAPAGAELRIDGRLQGTCPFPKPLELSGGNHLITLTKAGYALWSREEHLARGETSTVIAPMPRTLQRTASLLMFGMAASSAIASGIFGYFAVVQENSADAFLRARGRSTLHSEDLAEYRSTVHERDQLRTASLVSAGVGLGLLVVGVFAFNYDGQSTPPQTVPGLRTSRPQELPLRARFANSRPSSPLSLSPLVSKDLLGATIGTAF